MIKRVSECYKHHIFAFIFGPLLKAIEVVFDLLIPLVMKAVIDLTKYNSPEVMPDNAKLTKPIAFFIRSFGCIIKDKQNLSDAIIALIIILTMGIIGFILTMITQYVAAKTAANVAFEVRESLFNKVLILSKEDIEKYGKNKLVTILNNDSYSLQQGVLMFIRLIVRAPLIILGSLIISMILNIKIGIIFAIIIPLIFVIVIFIMIKSAKKYLNIQSNLDDISQKTEDTLDGIKTIKIFSKEKDEIENFKSKSQIYQDKAIGVNRLNSFINPLTFAIVSIVIILVVAIGGSPILNSSSTENVLIATTIISEVAYLTQIFIAVVLFTNVVLSLVKANVATKRINNVLSLESSQEEKHGKIDYKNDEIIRFCNVYLSYEKDGNYALSDVSFSLNKGQSLGIIGATGSGKSSIISLIERFYEPTEGNVLFCGNDLKDLDIKQVRNDIALVDQKKSLFNGTIRSNLTMGNDYSTDDIDEALQKAEAYDFVYEYPDNINHIVLDNGSNYSGGQRQRLTIARALLKKSELIILDDSSSSLDLLTDKKIRKKIQTLNKTTLIISQRISSISFCDNIIVIDNGKIVAQGKHSDLLNSSSVYKQIYDTQIEKGTENEQ